MEEILNDGDIVWVKLSNSWWPGEIMGDARLSEEFLSSLRKKPLAVVKFFHEDTFEYVKNRNFIFKYNCPRKSEFLRKGMEQYQAKLSHMEKFPADVMYAERLTGGDPDIVNTTDFSPQKKERYSGLFQDDRSASGKGKGQKDKPSKTPLLPVRAALGRKTIHEVRILAQPSSSLAGSEVGVSDSSDKTSNSGTSTQTSSSGQVYHCYKCNYSANRQNLLMLHIKHCRASFSAGGGAASTIMPAAVPSSKGTKIPEPLDESDEEEVDVEPENQSVRSRRSFPTVGRANTSTETPIPSLSGKKTIEKRTRGGRKSIVANELPPKQKKTVVRRGNKRGLFNKLEADELIDPFDEDDDLPAANVDREVDDKGGNDRKLEPEVGPAVTSSAKQDLKATEDKVKTDVKLKNELLADWSEDEPEDDEGIKGTSDEKMEEDAHAKEEEPLERVEKVAPKKKEGKHQEHTKPVSVKKASRPEGRGDKSHGSEEDSGKPKDSGKAPENAKESYPTVIETAAVSAENKSPSSTSSAPTVSPYTTIKYRNIPKKQKREFIEVTNDDASSVQDKAPVPSREGSTTSSGSTAGSSESPSGGTAPGTTAAPATERPISAKQLILNRATRGSSKSLSGDEIAPAPSVTADIAVEDRKSQVGEAKKGDESSSCFDFNDDDDDHKREKVPEVVTVTPATRFERKREGKNRKRDEPAPEPAEETILPDGAKDDGAGKPEEVDRDAQLCQEIDSLLCDTDVVKLNEVVAAVTDKIDCNRTLPPKERGKRIFKTRNKSVTDGSSAPTTSDDVATEPESPLQAGKGNEKSPSRGSNSVPQEDDKQRTTEQEDAAKGKDSKPKPEDHQNPSVTSSAMAEEDVKQPVEDGKKKKRKSDDMLLPDSSGSGEHPGTQGRRRGKIRATAEVVEKLPAEKPPPEGREIARKTKRSRREASSSDEVATTTNDGGVGVKPTPTQTDRAVVGEGVSTKVDVQNKPADVNMAPTEVSDEKAPTSAGVVAKHSKPKRDEVIVAKKSKAAPTTPSPTELHIAETLINLPARGAGRSEKRDETVESAKDADTVASSSSTSGAPEAPVIVPGTGPSAAGSASKSINPRKRHLQSMLLTTEPKPLNVGPANAEGAPKPEAAGNAAAPAEQPSLPAIPDKKQRNGAEPDGKPSEDKFDFDSMPIVMGDNGLMVTDLEHPVATVKAVPNGAGTVTSLPAHKRTATVATMKVGNAANEQIVITSKGTILTTATPPNSSTASGKSSSFGKSAVTVTSAITLATSCRIASSTNGSQQLPAVPAPPPPPPQPGPAPSSAPKIILAKKTAPPPVAPVPTGSTVRRTSEDGGSSSVSSSSSSASTGRSHRVLKLSPEKLDEFTRLGYIENRGKGKVLTPSGMILFKRQRQQELQQKQQKQEPVIGKKKLKKAGPASASCAQAEMAPSGSNQVVAAAADSSVQESAAADRSAPEIGGIDPDHEEMDIEEANVGPELELPGQAAILLESPSVGPAEVILGPAEIVAGSLVEANSSSSGSGAGAGGNGTATAGSSEQESSQLIAVPAENFGGPPNLFYLCSVRDESLVPVNNELLYLDASNQLVALPEQHQQHPSQQGGQSAGQQPGTSVSEDIIHQAEVILPAGSNGPEVSVEGAGDGGPVDATGAVVTDGTQQSFLLNTQDGQHIILDQQSLMALAAGGDTPHILTADGQQILLQETAQEWLAALSASQQHQHQQHQQQQVGAGLGTLSTLVTPEGTQIIVAHEHAGLIELQEHPALLPTEIIQVNPNTTIETNAILTKPPIMSTVEVPTKNGIEAPGRGLEKKPSPSTMPPSSRSSATVGSAGPSAPSGSGTNLDETLAAVIGHVPSNPHVPTSLELPITVTNPVIAKTTTSSSRLNSALFPIVTAATTVSSPSDATVVLVPGAVVAEATVQDSLIY